MAMENSLNWLTACLSGLNFISYPVFISCEKPHSSLSDFINEIANIEIYFASNRSKRSAHCVGCAMRTVRVEAL